MIPQLASEHLDSLTSRLEQLLPFHYRARKLNLAMLLEPEFFNRYLKTGRSSQAFLHADRCRRKSDSALARSGDRGHGLHRRQRYEFEMSSLATTDENREDDSERRQRHVRASRSDRSSLALRKLSESFRFVIPGDFVQLTKEQ